MISRKSGYRSSTEFRLTCAFSRALACTAPWERHMEKGKGKVKLDKASGSRPKSPESQSSTRGKGQSSSKGSSKSGVDSKQPSSRSVKAKPKSPDPAKAPSAEDSGRDETSDPLPDAERDPLESVSKGPKNAPEELEEEPSAPAAEEAAEEPSEPTVEALVETAAAEDLAADGDFLSHVASVHRSLALAAAEEASQFSTEDMSEESSAPAAVDPGLLMWPSVALAAPAEALQAFEAAAAMADAEAATAAAGAAEAAAAEAAAAEAAAAEAAEVAEGDGADPNRKNVWVAKTGALAGKELDAAWVERMKKESDLRLDEQFTLGQHYWMQNPYFKDGTKLRLGPSQDDEMMDQYVLNDDEVEVMEIRNDTGFVSVRRVGSDLTGWVRGRNLSNIRREAGLQDLGELAQMAVDELVKREADMEELEIQIADQEEDLREQRKKIGQQIFEIARQRGEIARQRDEIGTLKQELVKVTAAGKIAQYVRAKHSPTPGVNPECEPGAKHPPMVDPGFTLPRSTPEHETALAAPAVSYGGAIDQATALEKANLQRELGAARDRVLELEQENEFLLVQLEGYRHGAPKEGYRVAELPLAQAAKAAVLEVMAMGAALAAERKMGQQEQPGPQVIGDEPGLPISALSIETRADEAAYARALKMQDAEQCASEVATTLKLAIEKSGFKIQTLFAEAAKLALERSDFVKALKNLGIFPHLTDESLSAVYDVWIERSGGARSLELKVSERARSLELKVLECLDEIGALERDRSSSR